MVEDFWDLDARIWVTECRHDFYWHDYRSAFGGPATRALGGSVTGRLPPSQEIHWWDDDWANDNKLESGPW